jgi:hypothetical protein
MRTFLLFSLVVVSGVAAANSLVVLNHSFETDVLSAGQFYYSPRQIPDWTSTATGGADRGVWNTASTGKDGNNIAFAYANNAMAQQLSDVVMANTTYTVTFLIGRSGGATTGHVQLYAGGTVAGGSVTGGTLLASRTESVNTSDMNEFSFTYVSPNSGSVIGQPLALRLAGSTFTNQPYVSFDNVRVTAVPEPGTLLALGAGCAALAARRRRKA